MASFQDTLSGMIPQSSMGSIMGAVGIGLVIFLLIVVIGVGAYFVIQKKKYNKKLIIFEKINGRWEPTRKDTAMEIRIGYDNDTAFQLKKHKKVIPTPRLQMGKRVYWIAIREDGEWINFDLEDIDQNMKQAGVHYLDKEVRYAISGLRKNLKDRFEKKNVWAQYGVMLASIGFIVILGIMMFLLFDKWIELANTTNVGVEKAGEVIKLAKEVLVAVDNVNSGLCAVEAAG
jgi:hypothetical protein